MDTAQVVVLVVMVLLFASVTTGLIIAIRKYGQIRKRFAGVVDVEREVEKARKTLAKMIEESEAVRSKAAEEAEREVEKTRKTLAQMGEEAEASRAKAGEEKATLRSDYAAAKATYDRLRGELALVEENLEDISFGLYKPHYDFDSSEQYRQELDRIRGRQKDLVKAEKAVACDVEWTVAGSKREGAKMQRQYMKLMLRAFNGDCDAAVAKVTWNNVTRMEERIRKTFDALNALGGVMQIRITSEFLETKLAELRLGYETEEKKHQEIEEQRRIKEQMREEEKALREAERAKQEAETEEKRYQTALDRARAEVSKAKGEELAGLNEKMTKLEQQLAEAQKLKERATSMAEITRSGHVYIISNIGSFGEDIFKIGMTRRLEPMDRVKELGDASVPFAFDIHAMIYSTDAPTLENQLHQRFADRRINLVNFRKEFFAVSINEIEEFVAAKALDIRLTKLAEAREYRETLARRNSPSPEATVPEAARQDFPDTI